MRVEVVTPEDFMGDVMGDLTRRRGQISAMEQRGNAQVIRARAPGGDVRLHYRTALHDPGPRPEHHGALALRFRPAHIHEELTQKAKV